MKMLGLAVPIIMPSFKEIGQQMSEYKPALKLFFFNESTQVSFSQFITEWMWQNE